ncbi:hypothetical protein OPV22_015607 [Ensete ventricosum]|uniref:Uncharacterized protein n=1 Tax=Ensete ventricosum TaxID=4639 RepID=A0AAV8R9V1_ENSVE|nr:hypothetical protein OPV22_015607 [Ensete ventricosum]
MRPKSAVFVLHRHVSMVLDAGSPPASPPLHRESGLVWRARDVWAKERTRMHFLKSLYGSFFNSERLTASVNQPNQEQEATAQAQTSTSITEFQRWIWGCRRTQKAGRIAAMEARDESEEADDDSDNTRQDYVEGSPRKSLHTQDTEEHARRLGDAGFDARKTTVDQGFEQYFSMLLL